MLCACAQEFRCVVVSREQALILGEQRYGGAIHAYSQSLECLKHTVAYSRISHPKYKCPMYEHILTRSSSHHPYMECGLLMMLVRSLHTTLSLPTFPLPLGSCTLQGGGEK